MIIETTIVAIAAGVGIYAWRRKRLKEKAHRLLALGPGQAPVREVDGCLYRLRNHWVQDEEIKGLVKELTELWEQVRPS